MMPIFHDRREAGHALAVVLERFRFDEPIVLGLPRGGVIVAAEVAQALHAPLDVLVVRKLGVPGAEELAFGAVGPGGNFVVNEDIAAGVAAADVDRISRRELREVDRRERLFRGDAPPLSVAGRTVIVVDDGLATGASMRAAIRVLRGHGPRRIIVAVPVASGDALAAIRAEVDVAIALATPEPFHAVGPWYEDFTQVRDDEVVAAVHAA